MSKKIFKLTIIFFSENISAIEHYSANKHMSQKNCSNGL